MISILLSTFVLPMYVQDKKKNCHYDASLRRGEGKVIRDWLADKKFNSKWNDIRWHIFISYFCRNCWDSKVEDEFEISFESFFPGYRDLDYIKRFNFPQFLLWCLMMRISFRLLSMGKKAFSIIQRGLFNQLVLHQIFKSKLQLQFPFQKTISFESSQCGFSSLKL